MRPSLTVPPVPHDALRRDASAGRSLPSGFSASMSVTSFPFGRFSTRTRAVWVSGAILRGGTSTGGQTHSDSSLPQRSHVGGRSQGVPAKRRVIGLAPLPVERARRTAGTSSTSGCQITIARLDGYSQVGSLAVQETKVMIEVSDIAGHELGKRHPAALGVLASAGEIGL